MSSFSPIFKTALAAVSKNVKERLVGTLTPTVFPSTQRLELPKEYVMSGLEVFLNGVIDIAGGAADGVLAAEQPLSLIRNMRVRATSNSRPALSGEFVDGDFAAIYQKDHFLNGTPGPIVVMAAPGVQAATPFSASCELPFELLHTKLPRSTLINGLELDAHELIVDWGTAEDLSVGGDRTKTLSAVSLDVWVKEFLDPATVQDRYAAQFQGVREIPITATANRLILDVKSNHVLRGILLKQFTRTAFAHTPVATIINGVTVEVNRERKKEFVGATGNGFTKMQAKNKRTLSLENVPAGYCFLDFGPDGELDDLIDTGPPQSVDLVFNVTNVANGFIRAYAIEILDRNL